MENLDKRRPRGISMSDREVGFAQYLRDFYHLCTVSDVVRFLILRDFARIQDEIKKEAGEL